jgi:plasmid stabilization system protein ParE
MVRIKFTDTALSDLQQIKSYISLDSPQNARVFIKDLLDKINLLSEQPYLSKASPYHSDSAYRQMTFKGYSVIYRVTEDLIFILTIFKAKHYQP